MFSRSAAALVVVLRLPGLWLSATLLLACALEAPAQTYTIKLKSYPDAGMTVTVRHTEKETGSTKIFFDGKLVKEELPKGHERAYALTVLVGKKGDAPPEKFKRVYTKATETQGGKTRALSYQGRTVVFEKKDGIPSGFGVDVVGAPRLDDRDMSKLSYNANNDTKGLQDRAIIPAKAVAVGESWAIDLKAVKASFGGPGLNLKASRAGAKLVKAYKKGKSQFGVIEVELKLVVGNLGGSIQFDPPAIREIKMTIDTAIDGSSTARTETSSERFKGKGVFRETKGKIVLELDVETATHRARSEEKADAKAVEGPAVRLIGPEVFEQRARPSAP